MHQAEVAAHAQPQPAVIVGRGHGVSRRQWLAVLLHPTMMDVLACAGAIVVLGMLAALLKAAFQWALELLVWYGLGFAAARS